MVKRRTLQSYKKQIEDRFGKDYSIIGDYINDSTPIKTKHNICGTEWMIPPKNMLRSKTGRCPKCYPRKNKQMTQKSFDERVHELVGKEYSFLEPYRNAQTKILCRHNKCGFTWRIKPANFFARGVRCPNCQHNIRKDDEFFKKEVYDMTHNEYSVLGEYTNAQTAIKMRHNKCGYIWKIKPYSFITGTRCPNCNGGVRMSEKEFVKRVSEICGDEYRVVSHYKSSHSPISIEHLKCGNVFDTQPYILIGLKRGCPICNESHGERAIRQYLKQHGIRFEAQKRFDDCKDKLPLPFDFYLNDYNLIIEYDGEQHFKNNDFFGGKSAYELRHKHDLMKNKYCKKNKINILRIPYTIVGKRIGEEIQKALSKLQ